MLAGGDGIGLSSVRFLTDFSIVGPKIVVVNRQDRNPVVTEELSIGSVVFVQMEFLGATGKTLCLVSARRMKTAQFLCPSGRCGAGWPRVHGVGVIFRLPKKSLFKMDLMMLSLDVQRDLIPDM